MRSHYFGEHRLKMAGEHEVPIWRAAHATHAGPSGRARRFRVDAYTGHGAAGTGPVTQWFGRIFIRICRAIFGAGLDPNHME